MVAFILRRLLMALVTIWAVSVLSFIIIKLPPGDYVTSYIAQLQSSGVSLSSQEAANLRRLYGLDQPAFVQYFKWMGRIVQGDFGVSMQYKRPVKEVIGDRIILTMVISFAAVLLTWLVALPIGIYSAVRQYSIGDHVFTFLGFLGLAVPNFMLALVLMYLSYQLFNLDVGGLFSPEFERAPWSAAKVQDLFKHLWLPAIILSTAGMAAQMRIMRANLLDELRKPYVVTARAKGLSRTRVIMKYPVRAALNPFASTIGYLLPEIVSGSIIVALVLGLPTIGPVLLGALLAQDMFLAGVIVLLLGVLTVIGTFLSDLLLMWIEPRIRLGKL